MATESILKKYDQENDILYIGFPNERGRSYADDGPKGIEIMRDMETDEITGIMIYYPQKLQEDRQKKLNQLGYDFLLNELV